MSNSWQVSYGAQPAPSYEPYAAPMPPAPPVSPAPPRTYSTAESVFAWVSMIAGYLFCRAFPVTKYPLGGLLFVVVLFAVTAVLSAVRGGRFGVMPVVAMLSAVAVSGGLFMCANPFLHTFAYLYALATYLYVLYALHAPDRTAGFSDRLAIDYLKAVFVLPFCSFGCVFAALFSGKMKKGGKQIGKILLGVALAIIPTAIVVSLLSYDEGFRRILKQLFDFNIASFGRIFWSSVFAVPIGMYLFGLSVSAADGKGQKLLTPEGCQKAAKGARVAPAVTVTVATLPLLFLYVVFFVSQWDYYMSAFTGVLPKSLSYATYAREGFFQLCAVAVINLAVMIAAMVFMKRREDGRSVLLTALVTVFSLATLVLIATALSKMALYIDEYGLTPKRVYATWLMVVIALVFLVLMLGQFVKKLPKLAVCGTVTVVMFAGLVLCGTDSVIARYNVEHYLDGELKHVDMDAMRDLGNAAIPALVDLAEEWDARYGTDSANMKMPTVDAHDNDQLDLILYLREVSEDYHAEDMTVWEWTLPRWNAEKALEEIGMMEKEK